MALLTNLHARPKTSENDLDDHDLACLADWANMRVKDTPNQDWKRAYSLIREGADLLLRRRARCAVSAEGWAEKGDIGAVSG